MEQDDTPLTGEVEADETFIGGRLGTPTAAPLRQRADGKGRG